MFWSWFPLLRLGSTSPQLRLSFLDRHTNKRIRSAERGRAGRSESPSLELEPEMRPNKGSRAAYVAAPYIHPIEVSRPAYRSTRYTSTGVAGIDNCWRKS